MQRTWSLFAGIGVLCFAPVVQAEQVLLPSTSSALLATPAAVPARAPYQDAVFQYDLRVDLPVTGIGLAAWITTELLKSKIGPTGCIVCERTEDGTDTLNGLDAGVRRLLVSGNPEFANQLSNVTAFALLPVTMVGLGALSNYSQGSVKQGLIDLLLVAEATVLAVDVNQLVKYTVGRERPFVHVLPASEKALVPNAADNYVSFYSGHTAMSFALATASGTVASLRGYRLAPVIWVVGIPLATLTGVLRINADRHYFTDVLTGAVLGSAMGFLGPWLHRKQKSPTAISLYPVVTTARSSGPQSSTGVMVGLLWSGALQ